MTDSNPNPDQAPDYRSLVLDMFNPFELRKVEENVWDVHEKAAPKRKVGQVVRHPDENLPLCFHAKFTREDAPPFRDFEDFLKSDLLESLLIRPPWA